MSPATGDPLIELVAVMRRLRAECAWKREQTHRSLVRYLIEESHEVVDAIETDLSTDRAHLREELGDLLLQVYFHAAIAEESGAFSIDDVATGLVEKLIRRNPHVFGDGDPALSAMAVNEVWESVKATEKQRASVTDGIPATLPALLYADKVLDRLERAGGADAVTGRSRPLRHLLVPSPFLGHATWEPVARALRSSGTHAEVVDLGEGERDPASVLRAVVTAAEDGPVVLIAHSNAGLYLPQLTALLDVRALVFVDAALPAPVRPETALAPPSLLEHLRGLVDRDGRLPPWTRWWPDGAIAALLPDEGLRRRVERDQPRMALSYFEHRLPVPVGWEETPTAYLAFAETYAEEQARAREQGWPLRVLAGGHLHQLVEPASVADAITELLADLVPVATSPGDRLLGVVADARATGVDPEQALRDAVRRLLG